MYGFSGHIFLNLPMHNSIGNFKKYEYIAMSSFFLKLPIVIGTNGFMVHLLHFPMFFSRQKIIILCISSRPNHCRWAPAMVNPRVSHCL